MADASSAAGTSSAASFFAGNQHNDVLKAKPDSPEARARLVEELKRRGNAAFKCGSMPEAEVLYSKAIEHADNDAKCAILGNRSQVRLQMGRFAEALEDAEACIALDETWTKAYFRAGKAHAGLRDLDAAERMFQNVLAFDEGNAAALKELDAMPAARDKLRSELEREAKQAQEREEERRRKEDGKVVSKRIVAADDAGKSGVSKKGISASKANSKSSTEPDLSLRGYRTLADGRKTTFFNRELTEAEKELLKDNKPQQVATDAEIREKEQALAQKGASAWNHGGTFEEREMSKWARPRLTELLRAAKTAVRLVDENGVAETVELAVSDVQGLDGDASITFTRGKQRHIFDFAVEAVWKVQCLGQELSGSVFLPDISGDAVSGDPADGAVEAELRWSGRERAGANQAALAHALMAAGSDEGLLGALSDAVHQFAREFRQMQ